MSRWGGGVVAGGEGSVWAQSDGSTKENAQRRLNSRLGVHLKRDISNQSCLKSNFVAANL